jgi:hypothetical protein
MESWGRASEAANKPCRIDGKQVFSPASISLISFCIGATTRVLRPSLIKSVRMPQSESK